MSHTDRYTRTENPTTNIILPQYGILSNPSSFILELIVIKIKKLNVHESFLRGGDDSTIPPKLTKIVTVYIIGKNRRPAFKGLS